MASAEDIDTTDFDRCKACHEVRKGDDIIVEGGRNGPNLYGIVGRQVGSLPDYRYGDGLVAAGAAGLIFDVDTLTAFAANPNRFLSEYLGENARSKMPLGFPDHAARAADFLARLKP